MSRAWTSSHALAANALHYSSDIISSMLVLIELAATRAGYPHADAFAAIGVAASIAVAGNRLGRATIDALSTAPDGLTDAIRGLVAQTPRRRRERGDPASHQRRAHRRRAHRLRIPHPAARAGGGDQGGAGERIGERWPQADLTITANPIALDDETILERVQLTAMRRRLPVHHVAIQDIDGRKSVALDLEVEGAMSLSAAHSIASDLEEAIAAEVGEGVEVDTHIEPAEREAYSQAADLELARRIEGGFARGGRRLKDPCATSTTCACANRPAVSMCCSIAASIGDHGRSRPRRRRRARALAAPDVPGSQARGRSCRAIKRRRDVKRGHSFNDHGDAYSAAVRRTKDQQREEWIPENRA